MKLVKQAPLALAAFAVCCVSASAGSLWTGSGSNERSMFADRKAVAVGDIVTIVINESAAQTSSQSKSTTTDHSVDASVGQFLFPVATSKLGTHAGALPATQLGGKSAYAGGGAVSNTQTITARAAVLVTEVLPNGNLVIEGVRRMTFSGETQHVVLHGTVRSDDISSYNTVDSSSIANARVEFVTEGDLTDAGKKGWIAKLYERLRPF